MWELTTPALELVFRAVVVYLVLLVLLRIGGKQQVGQLAPFDLVLLLIIGNSVENAMNGGDDSLLGGLILAVTLLLMGLAVGWVTYKSRKAEHVVDGVPQIVVHDGKVVQNVLDKERLTLGELMSALRETGCFALEDVRVAVLETNGHVSVLQKHANSSAPQGTNAIKKTLVG